MDTDDDCNTLSAPDEDEETEEEEAALNLQFFISEADAYLPHYVRTILKEFPGRAWVAGGFLRDLYLWGSDAEWNDIDLWIGPGVDADQVAGRITALFQSARRHASAGEHFSHNAITLLLQDETVQIIRGWRYATVDLLLNDFDFECCKAAFGYAQDGTPELHVGPKFFEDCDARRLTYAAPENRVEALGNSLMRVVKLAQRGWHITPESMAAVTMRAVSGLDLSDREGSKQALYHRFFCQGY